MNFFSYPSLSPRDHLQGRLLSLAAVFLLLFSAVLSLSPAVRLHTWAAPYLWQHWIGFVVWLAGFNLLHRATARRLPDRDPYLLPIAALLTGWGLLTIWRLDTTLGLRQTIWLGVVMLAFYGGLRLPDALGLLRRYKYLELTGGLLLTALTFIFGVYPGGEGPRLWLGCCGVYLQPSEPLKLLLIVYLAAYLADYLPVSFHLLSLLTPTLVLTGAALIILVAQRDLGTTSLFIFLYSLIIYLASGKRRVVWISAAAILLAGLAGYGLFDVIRIRVNAWLNPWADPGGRSYQIVQSILAVAAGGLFGSGPGLGSPGVVPVAHSDFIFSAVAEETGLLGTVALLLLVGLLAARGLRASFSAPNNYQRYLAAGLSAYLSAQALLIIGGNLRLFPLTGVTLPFVSYGGSSLLTSFIPLLLLSLISNNPEREPNPLPAPLPYMVSSSVLFAGLLALSLINGWWALLRASDLQTRADNPRLFITDRYVKRGALLDRNNKTLVATDGQPGAYTRKSLYPPLSNTLGYSNPLYGQAGLEFSQDAYLRGLQGNPSSLVWYANLLYNQPPPGLNLRLGLDLSLQELADRLMDGKKGAVVLLNAGSGEVLVMASHPYFDANQIETNWNSWLQDQDAPLLNRATQGQYSPGTALTPFLLAAALSQGELPPLPATLDADVSGQHFTCSAAPPASPTWEWALTHGCPGALLSLARELTPAGLLDQVVQLGFYSAPQIPLPVAAPLQQRPYQKPELAALGEENLQVTPLQMALGAAAVSRGGLSPQPKLVMAVQTPNQGWVVLPTSPLNHALPALGVPRAARMLAVEGQPLWHTLGSGLTAAGKVTWFLGGTQPDVAGTPLAVAVALEADDPAAAQDIGLQLLTAARQP